MERSIANDGPNEEDTDDERDMATSVPEGHQADEDGEHDPDECYQCLLSAEVQSHCRCGQCCRDLLIEVGLEDSEREPRIKELGSPIMTDARLTRSGERELEGYFLNSSVDQACVFLDRSTNLCTIYETRPLLCRLFNCDEQKEELIELGNISRPAVT